MSKEMAVIVLGLWTIIVPQLGLPGSWKTVVLAITGALIATIGFLLRGDTLSRRGRGEASDSQSFVEHVPNTHHDERHDISPLS